MARVEHDLAELHISHEEVPGKSEVTFLRRSPEMSDLVTFVVPKIKADWEDVAYSLHFDIPVVKDIQENFQRDLKKCCHEMFVKWLYKGHGIKPKTWSVLLNSLQKVDHGRAADEIIKELCATTSPVPSINLHPKSTKVQTGDVVCLEVKASGAKPLFYDWYHDDHLLCGSMKEFYLFKCITEKDCGLYYCKVWNKYGRVLSKPAKVQLGSKCTDESTSEYDEAFALVQTSQRKRIFTEFNLGSKIQSAKAKSHEFLVHLQEVVKLLSKVIIKAEEIKQMVDAKHNETTDVVLAGSACGIAGGALALGSAPFTGGLSLFIFGAGCGLSTIGTIASVGAKIEERISNNKKLSEIAQLVEQVQSKSSNIENEYKKLYEEYVELGNFVVAMLPARKLLYSTDEQKAALGISLIFNQSQSKKYQEANNQPYQYVKLTYVANAAVVKGMATAFKTLSGAMKAFGTMFIVTGILIDIFDMGKSVANKNKKCEASIKIAATIEQFKKLHAELNDYYNSFKVD